MLHMAAPAGKDEQTCRVVNEEGTGALLAPPRRTVRGRSMSCSWVRRRCTGTARAEGEVLPRPTSATSLSRLAGEQLVLAAGGTVVRPYLVYGRGDTWVVPAVMQLLSRFPYWIDEGRPRISLVAADDLAAAIMALAVRPGLLPAGQVLHGSPPVPVRVRDLVTEVAAGLGLDLPERSLTLEEASARIGVRAGRSMRMLSTDHWFTSSRLWALSGCPAGPRFPARFAQYVPWYRSALTAG
ncbi:NAD(P)-dependent oxidoreductase [Streptomyces sp. NPDC050534]|uniref:NAD(P)-dependent oxidoreductase n=1 Tax=Streptomyces sp. NPDC050534 TaxID=3365625 RepID=UPI0037916E85